MRGRGSRRQALTYPVTPSPVTPFLDTHSLPETVTYLFPAPPSPLPPRPALLVAWASRHEQRHLLPESRIYCSRWALRVRLSRSSRGAARPSRRGRAGDLASPSPCQPRPVPQRLPQCIVICGLCLATRRDAEQAGPGPVSPVKVTASSPCRARDMPWSGSQCLGHATGNLNAALRVGL